MSRPTPGPGAGSARDRELSELLAAFVDSGSPAEAGGLLVANDPGRVLGERLARAGTPFVAWQRKALEGAAAAPLPPAGPFTLVLARKPREREAFAFQCALLGARLVPEGRLVVVGANEEGGRSAWRTLEEHFSVVRELDARSRARVLEAHGPLCPGPPPARDEELGRHETRFAARLVVGSGPERREAEVELVTYPGVFPGTHVDEASALLLAALERVPLRSPLLDLGCGQGVLALGARLVEPSLEVLALDVDALAIEATRRNVPGAELLLADGLAGLPRERRFGTILSNPPIHRGREEDRRVVESLVRRAPTLLAPGGTLALVVQRRVALAPLFRQSLRRAERLAQNSRFEVWAGRA